MFLSLFFLKIHYEMPVIILKQTSKMELKLFISRLENDDTS